jgi:hypothetical protein
MLDVGRCGIGNIFADTGCREAALLDGGGGKG